VTSYDKRGSEYQMVNPFPEKLWTVQDLAAWMRVTPASVRAMLRRHELPSGAS